MKIYYPDNYLKDLAKLLSDYNLIKKPKDINKLFDNKIHINSKGEIIGWQILSKEIKFWGEVFLDIDENAEKLAYNDFLSFSNCSYHFQPDSRSEFLKFFRIDFKDGEHHANQETHESCKSHLYSDELELKINQFNVIVSIYITINYLNNRSKYPLSDKNADFYNNIIDGLEGKY